jgi:hypothetical protein
MTQYVHPVLGRDLLASPEMCLRYPTEGHCHESSFDEGSGGFDGTEPYAYAARWTTVDGPVEVVTGWYEDQLMALAWHRCSPQMGGNAAFRERPR